MDHPKRAVLQVWAMKQELTRWAASLAEREVWFAQKGGYSRLQGKLKPECVRKHKANKNVIGLSRFRSAAPGERQTSPDGSSLRPAQRLSPKAPARAIAMIPSSPHFERKR
jgi:hypothetical protein